MFYLRIGAEIYDLLRRGHLHLKDKILLELL